MLSIKLSQTINPHVLKHVPKKKKTAGNHPKTFNAMNTVYVMKQGTHIQFQLVTV